MSQINCATAIANVTPAKHYHANYSRYSELLILAILSLEKVVLNNGKGVTLSGKWPCVRRHGECWLTCHSALRGNPAPPFLGRKYA